MWVESTPTMNEPTLFVITSWLQTVKIQWSGDDHVLQGKLIMPTQLAGRETTSPIHIHVHVHLIMYHSPVLTAPTGMAKKRNETCKIVRGKRPKVSPSFNTTTVCLLPHSWLTRCSSMTSGIQITCRHDVPLQPLLPGRTYWHTGLPCRQAWALIKKYGSTS